MASKKPVQVTLSPEVARTLRGLEGNRRFLEPQLDFATLGGVYGPFVPGAPVEPVFSDEERSQIQGNVVPGFNKPHQHFLFLRFGPLVMGQTWLRELLPQITPLDEVLAFVRAFRRRRDRLGDRDTGMYATWLNIAFSARGLAKLLPPEELGQLQEQSFQQGLAQRSTYLGDPSDPTHPGHRDRWVVGGPRNEADVLVIIASDLAEDLERRAEQVRTGAVNSGFDLVFEQRADVLPGDLRGHEHFGFRDGISQPAPRGRASSLPTDFIIPRYMDPGEPKAKLFAKPGQPLVWPGQFIIGMSRQQPNDLLAEGPRLTRYPVWARLGSFVVCRRLRQNVPEFWRFVNRAAKRVGMAPERFAAALVGRWPSGAPLLRATGGDDPVLAADEYANNHFNFDADTPASSLIPIAGYGGDVHPDARADFLGQVCPHFAHIRKMNTRDSATEMGPHTDMLLRLILRRGIPYGPPIVGVKKPSKALVNADRGLMFLCYGSSIEEQFEFLQRRWANSTIQPNLGGLDPIIGQSDRRGNRQRAIQFPTPSGPVEITMDQEWVTPTGGGYFFSPAIGALAGMVAKRPEIPDRLRFYDQIDLVKWGRMNPLPPLPVPRFVTPQMPRLNTVSGADSSTAAGERAEGRARRSVNGRKVGKGEGGARAAATRPKSERPATKKRKAAKPR